MVSIQCCYTVTPSEPTPIGKLFSLCEQIKLRTHAPLLYVYNTKTTSSSSDTLHILKNSLSRALSIYYPLAGRLNWIQGSTLWQLNCNAKGAFLHAATCDSACLDDLGDFVPTNLVSELIPKIDYCCPIEDTPLLAVQVTRFRCGGFTIGVALCRATIDGSATMRFMNAWARLARGGDGGLELGRDFAKHDRSLLDSRRLNGSSLLRSHCEFSTPPPWLGKWEGEMRVAVEIVKLSGEQIKKLRMNAMINITDSTRPYSKFEVIAGHLWRCVSKARYEEGNGYQPTRLSTLVNCRNRLNPPLPNSFSGNAAFPTVTPTCTFNDLMHNPLSFAVNQVKNAIESVNDEYVRSSLDHIANERDMDSVRYNFHYPAKSVAGEGGFRGNPNLFVVSWMNFSFRDADFGWGEPVYFGPGFMDSEGKAFVMNKANGDGVIVAICLGASHIDGFKRFFYEDIEKLVPFSRL